MDWYTWHEFSKRSERRRDRWWAALRRIRARADAAFAAGNGPEFGHWLDRTKECMRRHGQETERYRAALRQHEGECQAQAEEVAS